MNAAVARADGSGHTVRPARVDHYGEQLAMQIIHRIVVAADLGYLAGVLGHEHVRGTAGQRFGDVSYIGDVGGDLGGNGMAGMAATGDFGHVPG